MANEKKEEGIVLNIGCGGTTIEGAINVDIKSGMDARKLPFAKGSASKIYCSHLLEHFNRIEAQKALIHWSELLEPGGELYVAVPDAAKIIGGMDESNWSKSMAYLCGGCADVNDVHKTQFIPHALASMMRYAGLSNPRPFEPFMADCSNYDFSLNLMATKRDLSLPENPMVVAVMPEPRLAFSAYHACWRDLLRQCRVGEARVGGAFWEKSVELGVKKAIDAGADIVLFGDYDTLFSPDDFNMLLADMLGNPDIDAITGVQMSRHNDRPLVLEDNLDHTTDLTRVRFAHFGFTLVKAKVFAELPRPWFMNVPGVDGWDTAGQSDADITFWRMMDSYGFKTWWDNRVILGHMDLCAIWPRDSGVMYQPMRDYTNRGKPSAVRFDPAAFQRRAVAQAVDESVDPVQEIVADSPSVRDFIAENAGGAP